MILVTRFDGSKIYLNPELIRSVEHTPDTVITMVDDRKMLVKEPVEEVVARFIEYRRRIHTPLQSDESNPK